MDPDHRRSEDDTRVRLLGRLLTFPISFPPPRYLLAAIQLHSHIIFFTSLWLDSLSISIISDADTGEQETRSLSDDTEHASRNFTHLNTNIELFLSLACVLDL